MSRNDARALLRVPDAVAVRQWQGMSSEYTVVPPHADADRETLTRPGQVGVAFTAHRRLVYESNGRAATADIAPGSTIASGAAPISWTRVHERTEVVEIYPDPALLTTAAAARTSRSVELRQLVGHRDGTVLAIASLLRRAHVGGAVLSDIAASTLAHRLVSHLLDRYAGLPAVHRERGLLAPRVVDQVADLVEARLHDTLTLEELAASARLSPFHFARSFTRTTGLAPHQFVMSRRMDRARLLLSTSPAPVEQVAYAVGYSNLSHFRRVFRRFHGTAPSAARG